MKSNFSGRYVKVLLILAAVAAVLALAPAIRAAGELSDSAIEPLRTFSRVLMLVESKYVEPVDMQKLIYGAIDGMISKLDPHSGFMDQQAFKDLSEDTTGKFGGLGIEISRKDDYIGVISPIDGTPAQKAGIQPGDLIIKIEGQSTKGLPVLEAVKKLRGKPGSEVKITIYRASTDKQFDLKLTRAIIEVKSVSDKIIEPGYGYLKLSQFNANSVTLLRQSLNELEKMPGGMKGLVLDLRNNPGGLLDQAVQIADEFLDSGLIVFTKGRDHSQDLSISASSIRTRPSYPIVTLVNSGSASASEILAGALQDNHRAVILGERTFGKASVQTILPLSDGTALRLTTAKYFTPSGRDIQAKGIEPDMVVPADPYAGMEIEKIKFYRERDLKNRLKNKDELNNPATPEPDQEDADKNEGPEGKEKSLAETDFQLNSAVAVLKSWEVFHKVALPPGS